MLMFSLKKRYVPYIFLLPAILGLLIFKVYPIMNGLKSSLFTYSFFSKQQHFVGLQNYISILTDSVFLNSLKVTLLFNVITNPLQIFLSFCLALLLVMNVKGKRLFRTLHLIPITVSFPIACVLWGIILNPDLGLINSILNIIGIHSQPFLTSTSQALGSIIGIASWKGVGYWALFLIAGLEEISGSYYEAADIDGANKWNSFIYITFPQIKNTLLFVIVADTISNFCLFVPAYMLTNGGPERSTDFLMYEVFNNAYTYSNLNKASAMIVVMLIILLIITAIENRLIKTSEE
jgi:multiple sugar transport system permease protein